MKYSKKYIEFLEIVYGKYYMSPNGNILKKMFQGIKLDGKKILDIGSGLGGVDFTLSKLSDCQITGIDINQIIIDMANANSRKEKLEKKVRFINCSNLEDLKDNNFDLVFSKESILHIQDKNKIFLDIFKKLKKNGELVILDWFHKNTVYSRDMKEFIKLEGLILNLTTYRECYDNLHNTGFGTIKYKDLSNIVYKYSINNFNKIKSVYASKIKNDFGNDFYFNYCVPVCEMEIEVLRKRELVIGCFQCKK